MDTRSKDIFATTYRVITLDREGNVSETLATADNFDIANAAYEAALETRTWSTIALREKSRIVKSAHTGGYDTTTKRIALLSEPD